MIDTLKISYPYSADLWFTLEKYSSKLVRLSSDGSVLWEKSWCGDELPSHFSGLRISNRKTSEGVGRIFFEFSLQKWHSETGYNNINTDLNYDYKQFVKWVAFLSEFSEFDFQIERFELFRVDLAQNYIVDGNVTVEDFLRALELKFSRHPAGERVRRYSGALFYSSSWLTKKMYWKWQEFMDVERKKRRGVYTDKYLDGGEIMRVIQGDGKRPLMVQEINDMGKMLRFELSYKREYLQRNDCVSIFQISTLLPRFEEEKRKYMTVQRLKQGMTYSSAEYHVIDLCKRYGFSGAKFEFTKNKSERYWRKLKRALAAKQIYLECIDNAEWRLEVQHVDTERDYILRVA